MSGVSLAGAAFWDRPGLRALLCVLDGAGEEARVVGGAVRNTLLGREVSDVDVATTALPEVVTARVEAAGLKAVPTGIEHGTVTVISDGTPFEVTTLREDVETDGRRAVVRFGRSWQHDAERRDFTMNALYARADGEVIDLVGGLDDLKARRVRFIGDADERIREDHLRILRLFRFHATYGEGMPDADALLAAERRRAGLLALSRERVRAELMKLLMAERAVPTLEVMSDSGLLQPLLAGIGDIRAFAHLVQLESAWDVTPDPVRRLAALALRVPDDVERLHQRLRLSNAEARRLLALAGPAPAAQGHGAQEQGGQEGVQQAARAALYRLGAEAVTDRALLAAAHLWKHGNGANGADAALRALVTLARDWTAPRFPLAAADFMSRGLKPGPALGAALARAEAAWIAADFTADATALVRIADAAAEQAGVK